MAPARGSSRYAFVRAGARRRVSVGFGGGGGIRLAGMLAMMLIIRRIWGARVLVNTVRQEHRSTMHCVQESRVKEFE